MAKGEDVDCRLKTCGGVDADQAPGILEVWTGVGVIGVAKGRLAVDAGRLVVARGWVLVRGLVASLAWGWTRLPAVGGIWGG